MKTFLAWLHSRDGGTAIEYGIIAGGVAVAILAAIFLLGDNLEILFNAVGTAMTSVSDKV